MKKIKLKFFKNYSENLIILNNKTNEWEKIEELAEHQTSGETLIFIANLYNNAEKIEKIIESIPKPQRNLTDEQYFEKILNSISKIVSNKLAKLFVMDVVNEYLDSSEKSLETIPKKIIDNIHGIIRIADVLAELANSASTENNYPLISHVLEMVGYFGNSVYYGVLPADLNGKLYLLDIFTVTKAKALLELELVLITKDEILVKKCDNCGNYFIPSSRSDEIYCENTLENGKTCKQMGYENKIKKDKILSTYRTIYKTQNARKLRNQKNNLLIDVRFKNWVNFAKLQLIKCKAGEITCEDFKQSIENSDWLKEGTLNG